LIFCGSFVFAGTDYYG
jgi:hypothetical protein